MRTFQPSAVHTVHNGLPLAAETAAMPQRILIVDDHAVLTKNMQAYLSRGLSDVRTAASATQALQMLDSFAPDALVLDYGLPDFDGLQTYAEIIRRQARKIVCVMVTGNPTEQLRKDARDSGIHHIVCKPFRFSELQRLLEAAMAATANDVPEKPESAGLPRGDT